MKRVAIVLALAFVFINANAQGWPAKPVKFIVPKEGAVYVVFDCAILKGAPHPNAARLLLDFMLSDEVQLIYAGTGYGMAVGGLENKLSPEMRQLSSVKLLGTSVMKLQDKMLELAQQIYH